MLVAVPYRYITDRVPFTRKVLYALTSEQWTLVGFTCLLLSAVAGHFGSSTAYILLLLGHDVCDLNDGYVYQQKENGIANGYGLYIDHILDSIGAGFVTYGGYQLFGEPLGCAIGLAGYYLIAIHAWLYKISMVTKGQMAGVYFGVVLSEDKKLWLNVDDITVLIAIIVLSKSMLLLYLLNALLATVLVVKVVGASLELRKTMWLPPGIVAQSPANGTRVVDIVTEPLRQKNADE